MDACFCDLRRKREGKWSKDLRGWENCGDGSRREEVDGHDSEHCSVDDCASQRWWRGEECGTARCADLWARVEAGGSFCNRAEHAGGVFGGKNRRGDRK